MDKENIESKIYKEFEEKIKKERVRVKNKEM